MCVFVCMFLCMYVCMYVGRYVSCVCLQVGVSFGVVVEGIHMVVEGKYEVENWLEIPGGPKITEQSIFLGLCSDQQLSFFTLLERTSFPHYNNTKINKFG